MTCPKNVGSSDTDKVFGVSVVGNGGDDELTSTGFGMVSGSTFRPIAVTLSGSAGNDTLTADGGYSNLVGGTGDDTLTSGPGGSDEPQFRDHIYGSEGNDTIDTVTNSSDVDVVYCDTQYDQSYTDTLTRGSNDVEAKYFAFPNHIPGGCDHVVSE
ncbi:hypothetical protein ACQPXM_11265 [Kribbella sp. CA-253562]|uniref:hypothetical protein n=1 Tax=Kribbella sp. CA-253562 TaxID=3239942 RepID=UPI003D8FFC22